MDILILFYAIGWLIAIAAIVANAIYFFYNKRRKKLVVNAIGKNLLLARIGSHDQLEVKFNDRLVRNPYIVDFSATNVGPKDIASKDFDADKPLEVHLDTEVIARLQIREDDRAPMLQIGDDSRTLLVTPARLAVGTRYQIRLLVDGSPTFSVDDHPLIDTDVVFGVVERKRESKKLRRLLWINGAVLTATTVAYVALLFVAKKIRVVDGSLCFSLHNAAIGSRLAVFLLSFVVVTFLLIAVLSAFIVRRFMKISLLTESATEPVE
jgi:hypothetical protein